MEQGVGMHPALLAVQNAEIYENLMSGGRSFSEKYGQISEKCQSNQNNYILVTGPNGSGKTEIGMGLRRVMQADEGLRSYDIVSMPFALFGDLARYKGKIRRDSVHGAYTEEEYRAITNEMFTLTEEMKYKDPSRRKIFMYEMSTPSVYPDVPDILQLPWNLNNGPVPLRGAPGHMKRDRGHSTGYTFALSRESSAVQMIVVEKNKGVRKVAEDVRDPRNPDVIQNLKDKGFKLILDDADGVGVDVATLDRHVYNDLNKLLSITYAPAHTIPTSDAELKAVRESILHTPIVSERSWYLWLAEELGMSKDRFSIVQNERLADESDKSVDFGYFIHSGLYQTYPQLLPTSLQRFLKKAA